MRFYAKADAHFMLPKYKLCLQFLQITVKIDQEKPLATLLAIQCSC